jgi:tetratricopeptide (TPR) repeat protein
MLANLSVEQSLMKASSYAKKGEVAEAKKLYQTILQTFSKNKRAQQGLANLNKLKQSNDSQSLPQEAVNQLVNLYNQGQFSAVVDQTQALTEQYPDAFIIWNIMGASKFQIGMLDEAIEAYNKSIILKPNYAEAYSNMGLALQHQGRWDKAIEAYNTSISLKPNDADTYYNMGNALKDQGKFDEAIEVYNKALSLKPNNALAYSNMGNVLKDQGKLDQAVTAYNKALSLKPDYAEAYNNLGVALKNQGKLVEAIDVYNKALSLKPDYAEAYNNMGLALQDQGKLCEAIDVYNKALSLKPDYAEVFNNMGLTLLDQGKLDEAIDVYNKALSLKPDYAEAYSNMGLALLDQGKLDQAIEVYNKSISLKPDYAKAHQNLTFALLNKGRLKEGLDVFELRWKTENFLLQQRYFSQPLWDGTQSLNGKRILLWSEQGIGDTLNFSSCLSLVTAQTEHCILECQEKLVPLLKRSFPNLEVKPENRSLDAVRDDFDFHLPMGSLYKHFLQEITKNTKLDAYLVPDPVRVSFWKKRLNSLGKGPYVGIAWKSSIVSSYRLQHYPPISEWYPVFNIPDVTFINLQYKDFVNDLAKVKDDFGVTVHNFEDLDQYNNVDDVVALCAALDMAVTTKVTQMVLSSAVGTPTKIPNWRQSIWNNILFNPVSSSVDMFERNTWEPWDNVFYSIAEDISKLKNKINNSKDKF